MDQGVENVTTFEMLQELLAQNEFELFIAGGSYSEYNRAGYPVGLSNE